MAPQVQPQPGMIKAQLVSSSLSIKRCTSMFSHHFSKGKNFCDFLCASLDDKTFHKMEATIKGKNLLLGSKFFPIREVSTEIGDIFFSERAAIPELFLFTVMLACCKLIES